MRVDSRTELVIATDIAKRLGLSPQLVDIDALDITDGQEHVEIVRGGAVLTNGNQEAVGAVPEVAAERSDLLDRGHVTGGNGERPFRPAKGELEAGRTAMRDQ